MQPLVNIHSNGRKIYLFERFDEELIITEDDSFSPFFYEPDENGINVGYDGTRLRKITVNHPADIKKYRSSFSYSSDIPFEKSYLINKIDKIDKCKVKYFFLDIEVFAKEIPNVATAKQPISCISLYNSYTKDIKTWWLLDYQGPVDQQEKSLFRDFIDYISSEQPDIIASWNVGFDWTYLYNRYHIVFNDGNKLSNIISPIGQSHYGDSEYNADYPAGISIMDYLAMFKKVFMREPSYTLDAISQKYLNDGSWGSSNFGELTKDIRDKNINDVVRMQKLEDKFKLIEYFDEIRRLTKTEWEDLYHNSFIVENLLLIEARNKNIVLPNRPKKSENDDEATFEGAAREALKTGALFDIGKFDLTSAYPNMIVNFCLDATNIVEDDSGLEINGLHFQQDSNALIPTMVRNILQLKDNIKNDLKKLQPKTDEYENTKIKYDAIKGVVNSAFGVMGFPSFRLYDNRIASSITYLVRDLLAYTRNEVNKLGYDVIYWDTDSVFLTCKTDITKELDTCIQDWAKLKGKESIELAYEYEGYFEKIFIIALCRYMGTLVTKKGKVSEIKGAEAKRANSTKYEGKFQTLLIDKILAKETRDSIVKWIDEEKKNIKALPIEDIAFPCKISNKQYAINKRTGKQVVPIFVRAINNTNSFKKMTVPVGEVLWWIYVIPQYKDTDNKEMNVLAFTRTDKSILSKHKLDWDEIIRRNIQQKAIAIFEANGWSTYDITNSGQLQLL